VGGNPRGDRGTLRARVPRSPAGRASQIAFSRRFGDLEVTRSINTAAGTPFARQSNLDIKTGDVIRPDDRRVIYQVANYRHEWQQKDLVVWDNRCVPHRATPYDTARYKRLMQRTTISGDPAERR
jgi:hypothetical protein